MGKIKYIDKVRKFFEESPIVSINSLKKFLGKNKKYIYLLINHLIKRGEIKRLTDGFYSLYDDPSLAVFCFKPAYLGLQNALSIYNLWEQETIPVIITTRKIRTGIRQISGINVLIRRIKKEYFFGFEYIKYGDFYLPVSDIEKTFIDMIHFKQDIDKETLKNFKKRINKPKLKIYLKKYPKRIRERILNKLK